MGQKQKIEGATELRRTTREQIDKWNQMTSLRSQTGGGDIGSARPPFRSWPVEMVKFRENAIERKQIRLLLVSVSEKRAQTPSFSELRFKEG